LHSFTDPLKSLTLQHTLEELTAFELEYRAWSEDFVHRAKQDFDICRHTPGIQPGKPVKMLISLARTADMTKTRIMRTFQLLVADFDHGARTHAYTPDRALLRKELREMDSVLTQELATVKVLGVFDAYEWGFRVYKVGSVSCLAVSLAGLTSCTRFLCVCVMHQNGWDRIGRIEDDLDIWRTDFKQRAEKVFPGLTFRY
jgi:hypothetical protein